MVAAMDEGISNITSTLKEKGLYDDTLILFTTGTCKLFILFS
jgi:arylsulfatase A-like enzyme